MLGCGLPGGESGFNMGRIVALKLGMDHLPGATITRYCSSSLQTTRMALHAIRAGEGDVFISAGVETVSRFVKGNSDSWPDTHNPFFAAAEERTRARSGEGAETWSDPRDSATCRTPTSRWGRRENLAQLKGVTREEQDEFGVRSQNLAEKALADGFWAKDITPSRSATGPWSPPTTGRAPA
jgi:acetyl-CoA C-acetyltransferase